MTWTVPLLIYLRLSVTRPDLPTSHNDLTSPRTLRLSSSEASLSMMLRTLSNEHDSFIRSLTKVFQENDWQVAEIGPEDEPTTWPKDGSPDTKSSGAYTIALNTFRSNVGTRWTCFKSGTRLILRSIAIHRTF